MVNLEGVFTALVTPFRGGEVDWTSLKKLVRHQLDGGVSGLVVGGTTAESPTLSSEEKQKIFDYVNVESGHAIPLVMGTGSNSTAETIVATKKAKAWGADAALVVVPYYNKPSQRGLFLHYQAIAREGGLPVILYNVPSRTITKLDLSTVQDLSRVPGIVAIKEASGDLEFGGQITSTTKLLLSSGDDGTYLPLVAKGGRGVISVISNLIPNETEQLFKIARAGDVKGAASAFEDRFGALNGSLYVEANPIPVKYALYKMGVIASAEMRLPLTELDEKHRALLDGNLKKAGLL